MTNIHPAGMPAPVAGEKGKIVYIDRLRVLMTVLVILHHTAITYGAPGGWYVTDRPVGALPQIGLTWFVAVNQSFFMGFFFFLSALFTPAAFDRRGAGAFLGDRLKRLGIPLLVYSFLLSPVLIWLVLKWNDRVRYGFTDFLRGFDGWINFGVLWFVAALLLFTFVYVFFRFISPRPATAVPFPRRSRIVLFALGLGLVTWLLRFSFPVGYVLKPLGFQPAHFPQYIALYITGLFAARGNWAALLPVKDNRFWIRLASCMVLLGFPGLYVVKRLTGAELADFAGGPGLPSFLNALWEQVTGISVILALAGRFRSQKRLSGKFSERLARSAFAVYFIHPLVLVTVSLLLMPLAFPSGFKLLIAAPLVLAGAFVSGRLLLLLPGVNRVL